MAVTRNAFVELFWRVHPALYRWSGGRIGGALQGMPVLLLTLWSAVVARNRDYDEYRARTSRRIPVVVLERRRA